MDRSTPFGPLLKMVALDAYAHAGSADEPNPPPGFDEVGHTKPLLRLAPHRPSDASGQHVTGPDFGHVQPSVYPEDKMHAFGWPVLRFYHRSATTLVHLPAPVSPRKTGAYPPQDPRTQANLAAVQHAWAQRSPMDDALMQCELLLRSQVLPAAQLELAQHADTEQLDAAEQRQRLCTMLPPGGIGERRVDSAWPPYQLQPLPLAALQAHVPAYCDAVLLSATAPPLAQAQAAALTYTLACSGAAGDQLPLPDPNVNEAEVIDLCIEALGAKLLPAASIVRRFPALQRLTLLRCPKLISLGDIASQHGKLQQLALLDCPELHSAGADLSPFLPAPPSLPLPLPRVTVTQAWLCPKWAEFTP